MKMREEKDKERQLSLRKAFETFFKDNYSRLYYYALRYVPDSEICRDLVSDSFHFLWEHIDTFRPDTALTYTYTHLQHLCIDYLRRKEVQVCSFPSYLSMLREWNGNNHSESEERIRVIMKLIEEMPPVTHTVINLCYVQRKTYKEVAELTGLSESGVRKNVMKGLSIIRAHFRVTYKKGGEKCD